MVPTGLGRLRLLTHRLQGLLISGKKFGGGFSIGVSTLLNVTLWRHGGRVNHCLWGSGMPNGTDTSQRQGASEVNCQS